MLHFRKKLILVFIYNLYLYINKKLTRTKTLKSTHCDVPWLQQTVHLPQIIQESIVLGFPEQTVERRGSLVFCANKSSEDERERRSPLKRVSVFAGNARNHAHSHETFVINLPPFQPFSLFSPFPPIVSCPLPIAWCKYSS